MGVKSFMFSTFLFCQLFYSKRYPISIQILQIPTKDTFETTASSYYFYFMSHLTWKKHIRLLLFCRIVRVILYFCIQALVLAVQRKTDSSVMQRLREPLLISPQMVVRFLSF